MPKFLFYDDIISSLLDVFNGSSFFEIKVRCFRGFKYCCKVVFNFITYVFSIYPSTGTMFLKGIWYCSVSWFVRNFIFRWINDMVVWGQMVSGSCWLVE